MASTIDALAALQQAGPNSSVTDLMPFFPENEHRSLSPRLCRMRGHGLCIADMRDGKNYWTLTNKGLAELAAGSEPPPEPTPEPQSEPEPPAPEPEFVSELDYEPDSGPDPMARELLQAMELEVALEDVRRRLRAPVIPARTERVYREPLTLLPPIVRDALAPVTALLVLCHLYSDGYQLSTF